MKTFINVSNRLPVIIKGGDVIKSSGGLVSALDGLQKENTIKWVGWVGGYPNDETEKKVLREKLRDTYKFEPVFLSKDDVNFYYNCFSNASLWPLLHYMISHSRYEEKWYDYYRKVNEIFADSVIQIAEENGIVWIHDYHLMLLPAILRNKRPDLKIGFFLHTPFPSSEVFRCHPNRKDLLEGILGADLIGFHTFGYLRYFRNAILRVLGLESDLSSVVHKNHKTTINVYPIGINADSFKRELKSQAYVKNLYEYSEVFRGRRLVLSVERLDYTKGILRRLDAIKKFLTQNPEHDDIVFLFISIPSREDVKEYQSLLEDVLNKVSYINGKFSSIKNIPVQFINKSIDFSDLCALYSLADICMVTPCIDGMNLVAKEYVACQTKDKGVLILSEFAGAAQELFNALIVNPYNINQMADVIETALNLNKEEREAMIEPMKTKVYRYDAHHWGTRFLGDLDKAGSENKIRQTQKIDLLESLPDFSASKPLALFLDYDGTLCELKKRPNKSYPSQKLHQLFMRLGNNEYLTVFILSGRIRNDMDKWFSQFNFNLVAEHGYYIKQAGSKEWDIFDKTADLSWMQQVREILHYHTGITPGSTVEEKTASIAWHYRDADPEYGLWKANQLVSELSEMTNNLPVKIHHGKKIVEASSIQINKGCIVESYLSRNSTHYIICAGDDITDETMFRIKNPRIAHIKIGEGKTLATYRLDSPKAFRQFLIKATGKES